MNVDELITLTKQLIIVAENDVESLARSIIHECNTNERDVLIRKMHQANDEAYCQFRILHMLEKLNEECK